MLKKKFKKGINKAIKHIAKSYIKIIEIQFELQKIDVEIKKINVLIQTIEQLKMCNKIVEQKEIKRLQDTCNHKHDNGESAISDDAFASPYSQKYCLICKKYF